MQSPAISAVHRPDAVHQPSPCENASTYRPEFFRLPKRGGDPFFGLSRSAYYDLDRAGTVPLVRIRKPGLQRGTVLIPYAKVAAYIKGQIERPGTA